MARTAINRLRIRNEFLSFKRSDPTGSIRNWARINVEGESIAAKLSALSRALQLPDTILTKKWTRQRRSRKKLVGKWLLHANREDQKDYDQFSAWALTHDADKVGIPNSKVFMRYIREIVISKSTPEEVNQSQDTIAQSSDDLMDDIGSLPRECDYEDEDEIKDEAKDYEDETDDISEIRKIADKIIDTCLNYSNMSEDLVSVDGSDLLLSDVPVLEIADSMNQPLVPGSWIIQTLTENGFEQKIVPMDGSCFLTSVCVCIGKRGTSAQVLSFKRKVLDLVIKEKQQQKILELVNLCELQANLGCVIAPDTSLDKWRDFVRDFTLHHTYFYQVLYPYVEQYIEATILFVDIQSSYRISLLSGFLHDFYKPAIAEERRFLLLRYGAVTSDCSHFDAFKHQSGGPFKFRDLNQQMKSILVNPDLSTLNVVSLFRSYVNE